MSAQAATSARPRARLSGGALASALAFVAVLAGSIARGAEASSARALLTRAAPGEWRAESAALAFLPDADEAGIDPAPAQDERKPGLQRPKPGPQRPPGKLGAKKSCADCHEDFMKKISGATPHFADFAQRCEDCHDRHGLVGVLKLKKAEPELCVGCHKEAAVYALPENAHPKGAQQKCTACHDPHAARQPKLMAASGSDLCFRCHDRASYEQGNVHEPVKGGCLTCHTAHGAAAPAAGGSVVAATGTAKKRTSALTPAAPGLCLRCHDVSRPGFSGKHDGFDVTRSDCNSCHSPHAATRAGLVRAVVHKPALDHDCAACHLEPDEMTAEQKALASPPLRAPAEKLCTVCHAERVQDFAGRAGAHKPVKEGRCLECHAAHASEAKGLLQDGADETCAKCHDLKAKLEPLTAPNRSPHPPVMQGQCLACHDPHGGEDRSMLARGQGELCTSCHQDVASHAQRKVVHAALEVCTSCHAGHGSTQPAMLRAVGADLCMRCHKEHAERFKNEQLHKPVAQGQCLVCHEPHSSDVPGMVRKPGAELCADCHKDLIQAAPGGSVHSPAQKGECLTCHDPHSAPRAHLLKQEEGQLCASCHGITQKEIEGFAFRHAPAQAGACLACHSAHAAPRPKLLSQAPRETCLSCHGKLDQESKQVGFVAHKPFAEGACLDCHRPHGSSLPGLAKEASPGLCTKCHDTSTKALAEKHGGQAFSEADCLSCHAPHSAQGKGLFWPVRHKPFAEAQCQECHGTGQ